MLNNFVENDLDLLIVDDKPLLEVCSHRINLASEVESTEYKLKKVIFFINY